MHKFKMILPYLLLFSLAACGGGGGSGSSAPIADPTPPVVDDDPAPEEPEKPTEPEVVTVAIGGTVSGLISAPVSSQKNALGNTVLVLQNNGGDDLTLSDDGKFTFATSLAEAATYHVTVLTQPATQVCTVNNGSGTAADLDIDNITIVCKLDVPDKELSYLNVRGTVSGLIGSLVLQNNGSDNLAITENGSFKFAGTLVSNDVYEVTVLTQPENQICLVSRGYGLANEVDITDVFVSCTTNPVEPIVLTISGTVNGLVGTGLVIQNNGGDDLAIVSDGPFTFATTQVDPHHYAVAVSKQPGAPAQTCVVNNGTGTTSEVDITNVDVSCATDILTIGVIVKGLTGPNLVLQNNGADGLSVSSDSTVTFATDDLEDFAVTVLSDPDHQTCAVSNGSGTINGASILVSVSCNADTYSIGGRVFGLAGDGFVLQNNGGDDLSISTNGQFRFNTELEYLETYRVTIASQPQNLDQRCTIRKTDQEDTSNGTVENRVRNIYITCIVDSIAVLEDPSNEGSPNHGTYDDGLDGYQLEPSYHLYLNNGNFVVVDHTDGEAEEAEAGAVHLYDGATGELINTITGGAANDQIGRDGVVGLSNGNFAIVSSNWGNGLGAVTLVDGIEGKIVEDGTQIVTAANSLHGTTTTDRIGTEHDGDTNDHGDVMALSDHDNGNFVVASPFWTDFGEDQAVTTDDIVGVGAVTLVSGETGKAVVNNSFQVSTLNSLHGTTGYFDARNNGNCTNPDDICGDQIGLNERGNLIELTNGNYVVKSQNWVNGTAKNAGAVTLMDADTGYPVATPASLEVSINNSLHGTKAGDLVGRTHRDRALTNGNYVIVSSAWGNPDTGDVKVGAVTLVDGTTGAAVADGLFEVSILNSLHGGSKDDRIGAEGILELDNGNVIVTDRQWDFDSITANAGAVVLMDGTTGAAVVDGEFKVTAANALHGTHTNDNVGFDNVYKLTNGNYVVASGDWNGVESRGGAVTLMDGDTGVAVADGGLEVSTANSMYGTTANDMVGYTDWVTVVPVPGGNFALRSIYWTDFGADESSTADDIANVGAVTLVSGETGTAVIDGSFQVSTANSLHGTTGYFNANKAQELQLAIDNSKPSNHYLDCTDVNDTCGDQIGIRGIYGLETGNYVVVSDVWDNGSTKNVGAVTLVDATTGRAMVDNSLVVSADNSLHGVTANDGIGFLTIVRVAGGDFLVTSGRWDTDEYNNVGAVTLMSGLTGLSADGSLVVSKSNSVVGLATDDGNRMNKPVYDPMNDNFAVKFQSGSGSGYFIITHIGGLVSDR